MKEFVEKMQKEINREIEVAKGELRYAVFCLERQTLVSEKMIYQEKIKQIKEHLASLCYLSAICHQ